ncbi:triose-phosphate isomerase [Spiribacter sp. C176]|uniref:Triosephosphate isomerase n=1 Tax=Spiribacter salilacus TaxID=2664894 RepID=A0A6N7QQR0_9GAMM|nr:triose-phosphate isomerase [Spiribacter salilacus]MRH77498.1 triose-phosphate isomerase [Spiribacter salilacus]
MRTPLIAGNWKMNGLADAAGALAEQVVNAVSGVSGVDVVVCPPACHLERVAKAIAGSNVDLGAQNCAEVPLGARTGEIATEMLSDLGARYVIVGHSERRQFYAETDELIAQRYQHALSAGLKPILCVGETLEAREAGQTEAVIAAQVDAVAAVLGEAGFGDGVIAYEPVWAIGTGRTASAEQAQAVHAFIRKRVSADLRILYGGSMNADNAEALLEMPDVDGGLIGGASLKADAFAAICAAARQ